MGKGTDNDDYGVLHRYSCKSIESSVPTHTDDFNAQISGFRLHDQSREDTQAFLSAPTPRKANCATLPFSDYLEENCLPSVSIENAETGKIRWRQFPKNDKKVKVARKIDFSNDNNYSMKEKIGLSAMASSQPECENSIDVELSKNQGGTNDSPSPLAAIQNGLMQMREVERMKAFDPVIPTSSANNSRKISFINGTRLTHTTPVDTNGSGDDVRTKTAAIEDDCGTQIIENISEVSTASVHENTEKDDTLSLVRKVGPQLNDLLAQLKDNGLGEDDCGTQIIENHSEVSTASMHENKEKEENDDPLSLVRKVGPQLNDLLAQLKDNGLGE